MSANTTLPVPPFSETSDGRSVSIDKCIESLKDLFSGGAQLVQSLETRRRNKGWNLRFWSEKGLEGQARGLYEALIGGRAKIQEAFETAQGRLTYTSKLCQADKKGLSMQQSNLKGLMHVREEFKANVYEPLKTALNAKTLTVVDFIGMKRTTEDYLTAIVRELA